MNYCIYLRKSRADMDDERNGIDTLNRHQNILTDTANRLNLTINTIYKEVVSGDSIQSRPVMIQLLNEIKTGMWDGVLVVEIERLARGDTIDQGEVARAFKFSNTKIITPMKTYDPQSEMDEEFFEFALFMSRREYKTIKRRLVAGMNQAAIEGKFAKSTPAYGYDKVKLPSQKGYTLIKNADADAVLMIFAMFLDNVSYSDIAKKLELFGYTPQKSNHFTQSSIKAILTNPVYAGYIRNGYRACQNNLVNGEIVKTRPRNENAPLYDGLHTPIIDKDTFDTVQSIIIVRKLPKINHKQPLKNPFAGLIYCKNCGTLMGRKSDKHTYAYIHCKNCNDTIACSVDIVEKHVLTSLLEHFPTIPIPFNLYTSPTKSPQKKDTNKLVNSIATTKTQILKLHDLLEQGVYDTSTFLKRQSMLCEKLKLYEDKLTFVQDLSLATSSLAPIDVTKLVNMIQNIAQIYYLCEDITDKNTLLKTVIQKITYHKTKRGSSKNPTGDLALEIEYKI